MTKRHLTIATRESPLALQQAELIKSLLLAKHPHLSITFLGITTVGDKRLDVALTKIGGKGLFVKELEEALYEGRADIAVHSMKDVPMVLPPGLCLPVIGEREDPRDAFVSNHYKSFAELPRSAIVGTASLRRQTQLLAMRSDIEMKILRGNIHTRLNKLDRGDYNAIILASAGLKRMHMTDRISSYLSVEQTLPAAGQGALGIECREDDHATLALIKPLDHPLTHQCVTAERAVCRHLGGGCTIPIAAFAQVHHNVLTLRALVSNANGTRILRAQLSGDPKNAQTIGVRVAEELLQQGAEKILRAFNV